MDGPFFGLTLMDLPCLFSKARTNVFKVLLDVVVDMEQHFFELGGRRRRRRRCRRLFCLFEGAGCSFLTWTAQAWGIFSTRLLPHVGHEISFFPPAFENLQSSETSLQIDAFFGR